MALSEQKKKGGPYTKDEREKRQKEVYKFHFEKYYSAIKISEILQVNRNTINEDIKYWYECMSEEIPDESSSLLIKQISRLELQHSMLQEELEKCEDFKERMSLQRLVFAINSKIISQTSKITFHHYDVLDRLRKKSFFLK